MASISRQAETEIVTAFDGLAPPFPPASASSTERAPFDVFINHRGPDVKQRLATDIYNALHEMGLKVFLDSHGLQLGERFPEALEHAMSTASLHVAIFSPTYAQSPWCLAELSFMLKTGAPVIPIFYKVSPDDLRHLLHGRGIYAAPFLEHEKKSRYSMDKREQWKMALHSVSFNKGETVNNDEEERSVVKSIVNRALKLVERVPLEVATHPVGFEEIVADFEMTVSEYVGVQIIGIWGMGGSGKTTLAKELYNRKYSSIHKSSFLFDVRDAAKKNELHIKQRQLLTDLGYNLNDQPFHNADQGKNILCNYLRSLPVFVILDDVDHRDQLEALLPGKGSLASGSLVIVTTRDREVLRVWGISCVYVMKPMNQFHAKQLFCWHSFLRSSPLQGFENLVEEFVSASHGLPLSLKVFGAQLYDCFDKDLWKDLLHKISKVLPEDIINRLRISYDALDKEEKQMFLDIACFFIGVHKMTAIAVWEGSGCSGLWGWQKLENKCLVELVRGNKIRMHDHLRDLGREIASTLQPYRIWSPDQLTIAQEQIRGMILNGTTNGGTGFPGFMSLWRPFPHGLKMFVVGEGYGKYLHIAKFSRELAWLSCTGIDHRYLPSWIPLNTLRVLEFHDCDRMVGLWKNAREVPVQLRELIISDCRRLQVIPKSIGYLDNLKKLSLFFCKVKSLPKELCRLQSLEHLDLSSCRKLSSLPISFGHLTGLRHLDLSHCKELRMLPNSFKQLTLLQHLNLGNCHRLTIQLDILENMLKLEYINLNYCEQLEKLPSHITNQASLSELHLRGTSLRELPINIGQLKKLRVMEIRPVLWCFNMQSLPNSMASLTRLERLVLRSLQVQAEPDSLIKQMINLQYLEISGLPIGGPFTSFWSNLKEMRLDSTHVSKISISSECCPGLKKITLGSNDYLTEVGTLPTTVEGISIFSCRLLSNISGIGGAVNLQYLRVSDCPELKTLPIFDKLVSLKVFQLRYCNRVETIQGLEHCTSLEELRIEGECFQLLEIESWIQILRLRKLKLVAEKISAVEHCIQTIQKWPDDQRIVVHKKALAGAGSLLSSSAFPNLSVVHSFADKKLESCKDIFYHLLRKHPSDGNAMMLCLVINCVTQSRNFCYSRNKSAEVDEGRWTLIGVFDQDFIASLNKDVFSKAFALKRLGDTNRRVERGVVVKGPKGSVMESFHHLLVRLSR